LAVTPDGKTVYFVSEEPATVSCNGQPFTEIDEVSTLGGVPKTVYGPARSPAISPDGRYLAFAGVPECSDTGARIFVRDLHATAVVPISGTVESFGYRGDTGQILFNVVTDVTGCNSPAYVSALDPRTGQARQLLFTTKNVLGCLYTLSSDRSGKNIVVIMQV